MFNACIGHRSCRVNVITAVHHFCDDKMTADLPLILVPEESVR